MPGSEPSRSIAPLALLMLATVACGGSERESTLQSGTRQANPDPSEAVVVAATPSGLAEHVASKARALARRPYVEPDAALPPALAGVDYAGYRAIRFRTEEAIWRDGEGFSVQLLHPGPFFDVPVRLHVVDHEKVEEVPFDPDLFEYDDASLRPDGDAAEALGYSGFRVHYPLNRPDVSDEVVVFQGASYFRLVGPGHVYGLSSRGLAIGIGAPEGEEFPDFVEFWLVKPEPEASTMVFHALLDSPSVTGAYRFELEPGEHTVLDVRARLFAREDITRLGVAPMSTMYLHGPDRAGEFDDFRPAVHDSDGLMMWTRAGEWIWRPLTNRRGLHVTVLRDGDPRGFGLAQRERGFERYLDLEAQYHRRPSEWVEVEGSWGVGGVQLLEMPTTSEFNDNIAAAWVPDAPFRAGEEREYRYRLITFDERVEDQIPARVIRTGEGWDALPGTVDPPARSRRRFVVDFEGGALAQSPVEGNGTAIEPVLEATAGTVSDLRVLPLPDGRGRRVSFRLEPDGSRPSDMRLRLERDGAPLSETWSYVWYPDELR